MWKWALAGNAAIYAAGLAVCLWGGDVSGSLAAAGAVMGWSCAFLLARKITEDAPPF